ncbi:MAG: hemolysin family protein [Gammaproteobacteria bacterium]|jgi:CBS domain containing-hemolysin-like protein|nr:hemolysin family protein [Gammaproteobacteria bacterium]MBU2179677.1 hemolysin family protein [Gammaproteobacteria bacterium]MBU2224553.1 hemolysin family protein [Gammaproteobacteria bacterium]MBU2280264.1 hemolysin family protein [Gammaproteobacteria bacterium]MBU2425474.1 hemolysin family protein [Gammaproteobacteria bacterium]
MSVFEHVLIILALISVSAFFSMSEIALAASRKLRLRQLLAEGDVRAQQVLALQEHPGNFFTIIQIGLNAVAILGGIIGEAAFTPSFVEFITLFYQGPALQSLGFGLSVFSVTALFILFADLMPKRLAMLAPEQVAVAVVRPILLLLVVLKPLVWMFNGIANIVFKLFNVPIQRKDQITPQDIILMMDEGAQAGVLQQQEHTLLENVFDMDQRTVTSAMTPRESLIYFVLKETPESIKEKIAEHPHAKFIVCDQVLDRVVGYVDTRDILMQVLHEQSISLSKEGILRTPLIIPDTLSLYEALAYFKSSGVDFAVILNEYALVVGMITLKDVMSIVMGELVNSEEDQIVKRDDDSWLVEGLTPLDDVMRVLSIDQFPFQENYETIAGFMMYMLRKIPKRTDFVLHQGYKFEVVDIDNYKIDQLLVTKVKLEV